MFESQRPDSKAEHLRWRTLRLELGRSVRGWKCGPSVGVKCHFAPYSKPCKKVMTAGVLTCQYCEARMVQGFTGYLPMIDECGQKVVAIYGKDFSESVAMIVYGSPIRVTKGKFKSAPVVIREDQWTTIPCPWLKALRVEHDIRPWLLQLWKDADLTAFYGTAPEPIPVPVSDRPLSPTKKDRHPMLGKLGERFRSVEPSGNGKSSDSKNETH
jgi:hypothetical protein